MKKAKPASWGAIVVAAGRGTRFGRPKQLIDVGGRPLVAWAIALFEGIADFDALVVTSEDECAGAIREIVATFAPRLRTAVVRGGETRQESVECGLAALERVAPSVDAIAVHDGARPLAAPGDVAEAMKLVGPGRGALLGAPVVDTIKLVSDARVRNGALTVERTLDRTTLWAAQTPQLAMLADMRAAHGAAQRDGIVATDDAHLLERIGIEVAIVRSSGSNMKVTLPGDEDRAAAIISSLR